MKIDFRARWDCGLRDFLFNIGEIIVWVYIDGNEAKEIVRK